MAKSAAARVRNPKTYSGIHTALIQIYGNAPTCIWDSSHDKKHRLEWANVTGNYTIDIQDYLPMCSPCHRKFDFTEKSREVSREMMRNNVAGSNRCAVGQYLDGELVATYPSILAASIKNRISRGWMWHLVMEERISAGGFTWQKI